MLKGSHHTHVISSANSSSQNHSYEFELANKKLDKENKKNEKKNTTQLTKIQIERINDILNKYNLLPIDKNSKTIDINKNIEEKLSKFELEINPEKKNIHIINESSSERGKDDNNDENMTSSNKNKNKKLIGEMNIDNTNNNINNDKNNFSYSLSFKPINRETRFNNIEKYNKEKKFLDKTDKLLNFQQIITPRHLVRSIIKPELSLITKAYKKNRTYFDVRTGLRLNVKNSYDFYTKKIIKRIYPKIHSVVNKELRIKNLENQKKQIEDEKIPTFSTIKTSSSNSITKVISKKKEKEKIKSNKIRKKISKFKSNKISNNLVKNKKQTLVTNSKRLRSISNQSKISGNKRLRSISRHSKMSKDKIEETKSVTSRKNRNNNINKIKNDNKNDNKNENKKILNIKKANENNKYNYKHIRTSRDKKFNFIFKFPDKFTNKMKNKKNIDNSQINSSNSLRNFSNFNYSFRKNLLNTNKITEGENNKLNSSAKKDKDKQSNEMDFKKFLEEQKIQKCNQIRNFIKKHGMNSYNFFYPKEPSPLLGIFKKNCSIYPTLNINRRNSIEEEKKYFYSKNDINYSPKINQRNNEIKNYIKEKISMNELKENKISNEYINNLHLVEKHYGTEKDCPVCKIYIYKKEGENEKNNSKTVRYNKLRRYNKNTALLNSNSQVNINNNKRDFPFSNRHRINSPERNENFMEDQISQINKNFNILFDYFKQ